MTSVSFIYCGDQWKAMNCEQLHIVATPPKLVMFHWSTVSSSLGPDSQSSAGICLVQILLPFVK